MEGQASQRTRGEKHQRTLRKSSSDAERALWQHLRSRQLDGEKFRRQHPFENYILDFACLERGIAVELDGGQHADAVEYDEKRTAHLHSAGFTVLRFWNNDIFGNIDGVLEVILRTLQSRRNPSPPNPPLEGEG